MEPRPTIRRFATSVVSPAIARGDDAQSVTARLYGSLSNLVGRVGFDVLLARSIVLARGAHPVLSTVATGPGGTLTGLGPADPTAMERATVAIVAHFIELLAVLIGEDLAMRLVRDVWPEASDAASTPPEEEKE